VKETHTRYEARIKVAYDWLRAQHLEGLGSLPEIHTYQDPHGFTTLSVGQTHNPKVDVFHPRPCSIWPVLVHRQKSWYVSNIAVRRIWGTVRLPIRRTSLVAVRLLPLASAPPD